MAHQLKIITSTTREGRKGPIVADWVYGIAKENKDFEVELLDLALINLPLMDEPAHPKLQQYKHEHTKKWSAKISAADAFIIVLAEYNYGYPAPIKNALDFLYNEWKYKPVSFVSYGGIGGGMRSTQMLKQVVTTLHMVPIVEAVTIPSFTKYINDQNKLTPEEPVIKSAHAMLGELKRWSDTLKPMRS